ncbi:MAG TPA: hypothetical protein VLL08_24710 [Kineosporiaceae bacterium]|nr:hypothetical protein [Kineosporiaceae bacterium]
MFATRLPGIAVPTVIAVAALGLIGLSAPAASAAPCPATVPGDINGDGQADQAIGEPGDDVFSGAVHVLYGTDTGLVADASGTALNDQLFTQATPGVPGASEEGDVFGSSALLADVNGDNCADLVVGATGKNVFVVLYGSPSGVTTTGAQAFDEDGLFGAGSETSAETFGAPIVSGDFNDDGTADLAVGASGDATGGGWEQGAVAVVYGAAGGLNTGATAASLFTQASSGVPGTPENGDLFGDALAAGDFDGNGVSDLAVGVPGENDGRGIVQVLPGVAVSGVSAANTTTYSQDTAGVPGVAENDDRFGFAVAAGDATGDGRADLAVGAIGENSSRGAVSFLRGSASGLTGTGSQIWSQDSAGVEGIAGAEDDFGFSLVMAPLDNGPLADLAIGVPGDAIGSTPKAGGVNWLLGSSGGLTADGAGQRFSQNTDGIAGTAETNDSFGFTVSAAPIVTTGEYNLVISAPFEKVGSTRGAGIVHQLATFEFGPSPADSRSFTLDSTGLKGVKEVSSLFGHALS